MLTVRAAWPSGLAFINCGMCSRSCWNGNAALDAVIESYGCGRSPIAPGAAVGEPKRFDRLHTQAGDRSRALGRVLRTQRVLTKPLPVIGELVEVVAIFQALAEEDVHHRQREQAVSARTNLQVLVSERGSTRAVRIDNDELAALAAGLLNERPEVNVVAVDVAGPDNNQAGMREVLRGCSQPSPIDALERSGSSRGADRAIELRGAEPIEEPAIHRTVAKLADGARVAVRENALRAELSRDLLKPSRDLAQRFVP